MSTEAPPIKQRSLVPERSERAGHSSNSRIRKEHNDFAITANMDLVVDFDQSPSG